MLLQLHFKDEELSFSFLITLLSDSSKGNLIVKNINYFASLWRGTSNLLGSKQPTELEFSSIQ